MAGNAGPLARRDGAARQIVSGPAGRPAAGRMVPAAVLRRRIPTGGKVQIQLIACAAAPPRPAIGDSFNPA